MSSCRLRCFWPKHILWFVICHLSIIILLLFCSALHKATNKKRGISMTPGFCFYSHWLPLLSCCNLTACLCCFVSLVNSTSWCLTLEGATKFTMDLPLFPQKFSMQIIHIPWASGKNLVQASQCIVFAPMLLSNLFELLLSILCVLHCPSRLIAAQIIPKLSCFGLNNALAVVPPFNVALSLPSPLCLLSQRFISFVEQFLV